MIRTEKCVSICPHSAAQHNASDKQCFIIDADLRRTCAVHYIFINQWTGLPKSSYLEIHGFENEISINEHLAEKVGNLNRQWKMRE